LVQAANFKYEETGGFHDNHHVIFSQAKPKAGLRWVSQLIKNGHECHEKSYLKYLLLL
jgi:hypothetical protein